MTEHTIENFMKLATDRKGTEDLESKADHYYRFAFTALMSGKKTYWNWAAALGGIFWMLRRKMYLYYMIYIIISYISMNLIGYKYYMYSKIESHDVVFVMQLLIIFGLILFFIQWIALGLFGNRLYLMHLSKKVDKEHHRCKTKNISSLVMWGMWVLPVIPSFFLKLRNFSLSYISGISTLIVLVVLVFLIFWEDKKIAEQKIRDSRHI